MQFRCSTAYYTLGLVPLALTYPLGTTGAIYALAALGMGIIFLRKAWELLRYGCSRPAIDQPPYRPRNLELQRFSYLAPGQLTHQH